MKISVIIPVYNVECYLKRCLDSVLAQTYTNLEILLIDDGSTDASGKICDEYSTKDNRVNVFHNKNEGTACARNFALKKATGKYLFFVDGDDFIDFDTIEKMVELSNNGNIDIVYCDYFKYYSDDNKQYISLIPFPEFNKNTHILAMPGPVCKLIKKELFIENVLFFLPGKCFEDNAVMPLISALAKNYRYLKDAKYYYFQRNGSALNSKVYNSKWEDIFDVLDYMKTEFINRNLFQKYYQEVEYIFIEYLLHAANLRFFDYKEGRHNIKKVHNVMKKFFPNWSKNIYLKKENWKYKLMCKLFYGNHLFLISIIRRKK